MRTLTFLLLVGLASPLLAQDAAESLAVPTLKSWYSGVQSYVAAAAEQMPEEHYGYQPTEEVRTFGQIIGHLANAQFMICSSALGEESPNTENIEETATTKADLVEALSRSNEYCNRAYELSDEAAGGMVSFFGSEAPALSPLVLNYGHMMEHYGNIVTYMREKGQVPPSSQQG